jgi:hypothetical protein
LLSVVILCSIYFESVSPVVVVVVDFLRVLMKDVKATLLQDNKAISVRNFLCRISESIKVGAVHHFTNRVFGKFDK